MLSAVALLSGSSAFLGGVAPVAPMRAAAPVMETKADLEALATKLNPVVGFWDPMDLASQKFWGTSEEATIGFLREAEIKHGRVAMAGFVGFIVHSNGIRIPGDQIANAVPTGIPAAAVWDAIPDIAKWQIILFVGVMELWRENKVVLENAGEKHYMSGGKPGYFPPFDMVPHPVPLNLFDPLGFSKGRSEEAKARGRLAEINNGRLAQISLIAFLSESKLPGSVPLLKGLIPAYSGEPMAPFTENIFFAPHVL